MTDDDPLVQIHDAAARGAMLRRRRGDPPLTHDDTLHNVGPILPDRSKRSTTQLTPRHGIDPRAELQKQVGDISEFKIFHNLVLVAVYMRPHTMTYGTLNLELPDKSLREDEWQGTVGLVLKKGAAAFRDDGTKTFYGDNVDVGDWVWFRAADGVRMKVKGVLCRRIEDIYICGMIPHPDYVY